MRWRHHWSTRSWSVGSVGSAEELASAGYEPLDEHTVIRMHVQEVHNVTIEALEGSSQLGATWTLPDGQIWMIQVQSEEG